MKAIIDRFESSYAVVLVGEKETELQLPRELLPQGAKEGSCLNIDISLDQAEEKQRRERIAAKLQKLKRRNESV